LKNLPSFCSYEKNNETPGKKPLDKTNFFFIILLNKNMNNYNFSFFMFHKTRNSYTFHSFILQKTKNHPNLGFLEIWDMFKLKKEVGYEK